MQMEPLSYKLIWGAYLRPEKNAYFGRDTLGFTNRLCYYYAAVQKL